MRDDDGEGATRQCVVHRKGGAVKATSNTKTSSNQRSRLSSGGIRGGGSGRKIGAGGTDIPDLYPFRDEFVALKF